MRPLLKAGLVAAGYVAAVLIASAVTAVRVAYTSGPDAQAASGMYAAGDAMLFVAVFGMCALVPTGAALFFLRPYRRFWTALSTLVVVVAITGVGAAGLFAIGRHAPPSLLATSAAFSVLRILLAPLLAMAFLVFALFAPARAPRVAFLASTTLELAVSAYGGFVWVIAPHLLA